MNRIPLDAIPDLSDTQVIVYSRWDRSPDIIEDQVTYPIVSAMLGAPKVKDVRGFSDFGYSYVYIIFEEGTDIYWARSRTLEYLSKILPRLPQGVQTELGPDATGVGWVFQYALVGQGSNLAELRSAAGLVPALSPAIRAGRGGSRAAGRLRAAVSGQRRSQPAGRVQHSDHESGGRGARGQQRCRRTPGGVHRPRVHGARPRLREVAGRPGIARRWRVSATGVPVRVRDVGSVSLGPDMRRGVADLDGQGEAVSGIVVMRQGENALRVIERVKAKLKEIEPGLPAGVKLVTTYDRSELILASIDNLKHTLIEELIVVGLVILIFLWHVPSAIIPILTIPVAVLISFIPMHAMGMSSNIMSLGGIAIAVGAMVDAAIVVVEQTHKKLEGAARDWTAERLSPRHHRRGEGSRRPQLLRAAGDRGLVPAGADAGSAGRPAVQAAGLHQEFRHDRGRGAGHHARPGAAAAFHPHGELPLPPRLSAGSINAVLVGKIHSEEKHPISRILMRLYEPVVAWSLRWKWLVIAGALAHGRGHGSGLPEAGLRVHAAAG